jgi:hypothetical protein
MGRLVTQGAKGAEALSLKPFSDDELFKGGKGIVPAEGRAFSIIGPSLILPAIIEW